MSETKPGLDASLNEEIKTGDKLRAYSPRPALVAILDALGARDYSGDEVARFLESRDFVLDGLAERAGKDRIPKDRLKVFTFNDTVVIVYFPPEERIDRNDVRLFSIRLRSLMMHSLRNRILFRGAIAAGDVYVVEDDTNTVMGPAVTDAASWYDKADWIGIQLTPHASLFVRSLLEDQPGDTQAFLVDYDIPLRGNSTVAAKAINWPKGFNVKGLMPDGSGSAKSKLLTLLAQHRLPPGTETKYKHTIEFFDKCEIIRKELESGNNVKLSPGAWSASPSTR